MDRVTPMSQTRFFRGWLVVAGAFAVTCFGFGSAYTFGVFLAPLQAQFGASRGSVSLVFSLAAFLYFGLGSVSGPLADRWGARRFAVAGMILTGLGLAAAAFARTLAQVYGAYGVGVGLGIGLSYVPALGAVQRWFTRRRGFASGIAVSGIGVGTLVMPPLAGLLIDHIGWRHAYLALGATVALLGGGLALLVESDPGARGLAPDGAAQETMEAARPLGMETREAVRTPLFAGLYLACLVCSFGVFVPFVDLVPYARVHGVTQADAVLLLGMIGIGSTAGRFVLGGVADRFGRHRALLMMFVGMAVALGIWALATRFASLIAFALLFGLFYGGWVAILPSVVMDCFGGRAVSGIIGLLYTSVAFGTLIGPSATGYVFDATHSYTVPILASAASALAAAGIAALALRPGAAWRAAGGPA